MDGSPLAGGKPDGPDGPDGPGGGAAAAAEVLLMAHTAKPSEAAKPHVAPRAPSGEPRGEVFW